MICCPRTMGSRRGKAVTLLVMYVIGSCGLLHFLLQTGKLRANEEEKTSCEDLYRNQRQEPAVTLNVSRLVSVASANTSHAGIACSTRPRKRLKNRTPTYCQRRSLAEATLSPLGFGSKCWPQRGTFCKCNAGRAHWAQALVSSSHYY